MMSFDEVVTVWTVTLLWMAGLGVVFALLSRRYPCNPGMAWWRDRRAAAADFCYWLLLPLLTRMLRLTLLSAGMIWLLGIHDEAAARDFLMQGYGPLADIPVWAQALLILLLQDVYLYWMHRFFHSGSAWRYHAVHHSPKTLDWMSTSRFHVINSLLSFVMADIIMLLAGFSPAAFVLLAPFNTAFSAFVHANLRWTFGPFRYVIASPVFHRWHHTAVREGGMKNFAPTFPVLDILFGTFYMPRDRLPAEYGIDDPHMPESFFGQLVYPFRRQ